MQKTYRAVFFATLTQHCTQLISFITILTLARLLEPSEIGVFAVASAVAFLAIEFRSMGVGLFLVKEKELSKQKIQSAFGLMIIISWLLGAVIFFMAPVFANIYEEPDLKKIFQLLAPTFFLAPFAAIPWAILTREMKFDLLLRIRIFAAIVQSSTTIIFVLLGFSYFGLAYGMLAGAFAEILATSFVRPKDLPWLPRFDNLRGLLKFGLLTSSGNSIKQLSQNVPDLVLGKLATMTDVGLFSRGFGLVLFMNRILVQAVAPAVLPHFSNIKRAGQSLGAEYLKASSLLTGMCWPIFAVACIAASPLVIAMFGAKWEAAVPVASALSIWALIKATHSFSYQALIAIGKEKVFFNRELLYLIMRTTAIVSSARFGITAVAWALVTTAAIEIFIDTYIVHANLNIPFRALITNFAPSMTVTIACFASAWIINHYWIPQDSNQWVALAKYALISPVVWLIAIFLSGHPIKELVLKFSQHLLEKVHART